VRVGLGPVAANLLFLFAGAGLCAALGVSGPKLRSWLVDIGLSYMTGVAATGLALIVLLVVGIPFGVGTIALTSLALGGGGFLYARSRGRPVIERPVRGSLRDVFAGPRPDVLVVAVFVLVLAVFGAIALRTSLLTQLDQWDGWSIWTRKAVVLANFDGLSSDFFTNHAYTFMHLDYPLLLPVIEGVFFRAAGDINTQAMHAQLWLLLIGFAWAAAGVMSRVARPVVWAPVVLAAVIAPGVLGQLLSGYADVPMAIFIGLGAILVGGWLREREPWQLVLGVLMLGAGANVKNEGLVAAVALLGALTVVFLVQRSWRKALPVAGAWAGLGAAVLPWRLWQAANGVEGDLPIGKGLDPGFLGDRWSRVQPSIDGLNAQILDQAQWIYLVPLATGIVVVALWQRRTRPLASFYLLSGVLAFAAMVWAYVISSNDLAWHLNTSVNRVVVVIVFLAVAALLQVGATLDARRADDAVSPPGG
jgi:hypothetical protein